MSDVMELLPEALRRLADEQGLAPALALAEWRPGVRLWIPTQPVPPGHDMVRRLGRQAADWLVAEYGGDWLDVPKAAAWLRAQRDADIRRKYIEGIPARALALEYSLTERQIWRILAADTENEPAQQSLL